jgi:hypothetical protein
MGILGFLAFCALAFGAFQGAVAIFAYYKTGAREQKKINRELRKQLAANEKVLRVIANGAGNPELEAQIALDARTHDNEELN